MLLHYFRYIYNKLKLENVVVLYKEEPPLPKVIGDPPIRGAKKTQTQLFSYKSFFRRFGITLDLRLITYDFQYEKDTDHRSVRTDWF